MLKKFNIAAPNGTAWLCIAEGVVTHLDTKHWSDTHVSSSGGVGVTNVTSRTNHRQQTQFWIREVDGTEREFTLMDDRCNFTMAPGHKVRIAWGANENKDRGRYLFARNFNSRVDWNFYSKKDWHDWCSKENLVVYPETDGCFNKSMGCLLYPALIITGCIVYYSADAHLKHSIRDFNQLSLAPKILIGIVATILLKEFVAWYSRGRFKRKMSAQTRAAEEFRDRMLNEFHKAM